LQTAGDRPPNPSRSESPLRKACHQGARVLVALITGKLAGGMSIEEVACEYAITEEDVRLALRYAAERFITEGRFG
jgi:uncharacterized protein (DUF433 family)